MLFEKKEFLARIGAVSGHFNLDVMQIAWQTSRNKHYAAFGLLFQINCAGSKQVLTTFPNLNNNCALAKESTYRKSTKKTGRRSGVHPSEINHHPINPSSIHHHLSPIRIRMKVPPLLMNESEVKVICICIALKLKLKLKQIQIQIQISFGFV